MEEPQRELGGVPEVHWRGFWSELRSKELWFYLIVVSVAMWIVDRIATDRIVRAILLAVLIFPKLVMIG